MSKEDIEIRAENLAWDRDTLEAMLKEDELDEKTKEEVKQLLKAISKT